jgi:hypothetical protein
MNTPRSVRLDITDPDNPDRVTARHIVSDHGTLTVTGNNLTEPADPTAADTLLANMDPNVHRMRLRRVGPLHIITVTGNNLAWTVNISRRHIIVGGGRLGLHIRRRP